MRPRKIDHNRVIELKARGLSGEQVARKLGKIITSNQVNRIYRERGKGAFKMTEAQETLIEHMRRQIDALEGFRLSDNSNIVKLETRVKELERKVWRKFGDSE